MNTTMIMETGQSMLERAASVFDLKNKNLSQTDIIALVIAAAIGILFCFLGLKMVRIWAAFFGLTVGFAGGTYVSDYFGAAGNVSWIIGLVLGLVFAVLAAKFYVAGVMVVSWILGIIVSAIIMAPADWMQILICVGIGLVVGLSALKFTEPATMIITAIFGGSTAGRAIFGLLPFDSAIIHTAIAATLMILGIFLQFLLESKRKKKLHLKKAAEIRSRHSTANEVDQARAMLDDIPSGDAKQASKEVKKGASKEKEYEREESEDKKSDDDLIILDLDDEQ